MAVAADLTSARREVPDALAAIELYFQQGWTDGLPIVPPTEERVRECLEYSGHEPVIQEIGLNSGDNVFGPGWRANATIGRALRLVLMNVCRAQPGVMDKSTLGHPGKYSYCIAENEVDSPWEPLHVERGLRRDQSAVTVFAAEAPHYAMNHTANRAEQLAASLVD